MPPRRVTRASSPTIAPQVERVVERRDAERDVEARRRRTGGARRRPGCAGTGPTRSSKNAPAAEADQRVDDEVAGDVLAAARQQVLSDAQLFAAPISSTRSPGLDVAVEQQLEAVLGRGPGAVVPAEVAVQERQRRVDPVVGLVPALLAREHRPGRELAQLRLDARAPSRSRRRGIPFSSP